MKPQWIEGKKNGFVDTLSRFDNNKVMTLVSWQNSLNLMTCLSLTYLSYLAQQLSNVLSGIGLLSIKKKGYYLVIDSFESFCMLHQQSV